MNKLILAICLVFVPYAQALSATVSFHGGFRPVSSEERTDGVPRSADIVYDIFVTTDADILRVGNVTLRPSRGPETLYNNAVGSDSAPPNPAFVAVFPALGADSWITTPGVDTAIAGGGFSADNSSWFDTTDDGPQQMFQFARLTLDMLSYYNFSGVISVAGVNGPEIFPFRFTLCGSCPEPTTLVMAAIAGFGLIGVRRRNVQPLNFASPAR
ncbi:MAG: hypothetical protein RH917_06285 [Lacipirellulaceae bacterium]